jgi:ABC-type branched-subunit amino acid transport system permease subunit
VSPAKVRNRRLGLAALVVAVALLPAAESDFQRGLDSDAVIIGLLVLSVVVLTGFVGQISFCQYSFAAMGAFTVGSLMDGHGWSFWLALPVGVAVAVLAGVLVGIPALRLSGLLLAVLTVAVALFTDRFLLVTGTWDGFSGGAVPWHPQRPSLLGAPLTGSYAYYLFVLAILCLAVLLVWNVRTGKSGRVLRAVRDSELAAATVGLDVTAWKLAAFGLSAGLAGLAGALLAVRIGSVSPGSYDFLHSVQLTALATVMGVSAIAAAPAAGIATVFGPELLSGISVSSTWFPLLIGATLILQLVLVPEGAVVRTRHDIERLARLVSGRRGRDPAVAKVA